MAIQNLNAKATLDFIIGDFETAWDAIANLPGAMNRGNFLFGMHSMVLLEVACRVCGEELIIEFSRRLNERCPLYFTRFPRPRPCGEKKYKYNPNPNKEFWLPTLDSPIASEEERGDAPLLGIMFYLIRNGLMHTYQQSAADLVKDKNSAFSFSLAGPNHLRFLKTIDRAKHFTYSANEGNLWLSIDPGVIYSDIKWALDKLKISPDKTYARRNYEFDVSAESFRDAGFQRSEF